MGGGGGVINITRDSINLIKGISIHWFHGFPYDWVFPRVKLNDTKMICFMVSQKNFIPALKLMQYFLFNIDDKGAVLFFEIYVT